MKLTRRSFLKQAGMATATGLLMPSFGFGRALGQSASTAPHYFVLLTLRGGFDAVLSLNPQDPSAVGDGIFCGYSGNERIQGSRRLFGPLSGGLERHDERVCIVHGVRSDTTSHPDGLAMLARGRRRARPESFSRILSSLLPGDAPLQNLDLVAGDGQPLVREAPRPVWAGLRSEIHRAQAEALAGDHNRKRVTGGVRTTDHLAGFLADATRDAAALDTRFKSDLGTNLRLAFQAIRGNQARCIQVASRGLWFDSHSDNLKFQHLRQPDTWSDVATLLDLLASTSNEHGSLLDQTTLVVHSEIGRFPRLNAERGKDHFPENSWLLAGRGVKAGQTIGATDPRGQGLQVDFRSGALEGDQTRPVFIDNTFASLIRIAGGDPSAHGYRADSAMQCLMA